MLSAEQDLKAADAPSLSDAHTVAFLSRQLEAIQIITSAINENKPAAELYQLYIRLISETLQVERVSLYVNDYGWSRVATTEETLPSPDFNVAATYHAPSPIRPADRSALLSHEYIVPIDHKQETISYTLLGDLPDDEPFPLTTLLTFAKSLASIITIAVENKRLFKKEYNKKQMEEELQLASRVQKMLIPRKLPRNHFYEFAGLYLPFKGIGGDYYDVISINNYELVFCIGDISGKGIASALVMANLQAYLNAVGDFPIGKGKEMAERLNSKIINITNSEHFVTLFIGKYNILTRELEYLNAGHNPPLLMNGNEIRLLDKGCTILGMFDEIPRVNPGKIKLEPGATLVCYTDGLTEMEDEDGDYFGMDRLHYFLEKNKQYGPEIFIKVLYDYISKFKGGRLFNDDVSVLVGKFF
jgi:sigma-B regulation protein RsbU (phosphoserine phosphatase)